MSLQTQPQPQPQPQPQLQPLVVYPNTVTKHSSSHSNGSFGTVFIVLAVIVVVSAVACFLGRMCSRHFHQQKPKPKPKQNQNHNHNHNFRPRERDVEFGFEKRIPTAKPASNGENRSYKISENGGFKGEAKVFDDEQAKVSA